MNVVPLVEQPTWIGHTNLETRRFDPLYYDPALTIADVEHLIEGKLDEAACLEEGRKLAEEFGFEKP
jgi:hypothetical protein